MYNIQHATSYPYGQHSNTVEAQVRKFQNAYRSALLSSEIFKHKEWHQLYPLVIIRLNTLISKYGLSREMIHFQNVLDNHLPLITEPSTYPDLDHALNETAFKFRSKLMKFLQNKQKAREKYKKGSFPEFNLHELVMKKAYTPTSSIHPVFTGPYRILELYPTGALLKCPRTGEIFSTHFKHIRKLNLEIGRAHV